MQITIRWLDIASRAVAVLLAGLLLSWLLMQFGAWEKEAVAKMNHTELLNYLNEGYDPSFLSNYVRVLVVTFLYVGLVEGLALVFRLVVRAVRPEERTTDAAREFA
jgi:hypothetical protein